jgi:hypothetical protein
LRWLFLVSLAEERRPIAMRALRRTARAKLLSRIDCLSGEISPDSTE